MLCFFPFFFFFFFFHCQLPTSRITRVERVRHKTKLLLPFDWNTQFYPFFALRKPGIFSWVARGWFFLSCVPVNKLSSRKLVSLSGSSALSIWQKKNEDKNWLINFRWKTGRFTPWNRNHGRLNCAFQTRSFSVCVCVCACFYFLLVWKPLCWIV